MAILFSLYHRTLLSTSKSEPSIRPCRIQECRKRLSKSLRIAVVHQRKENGKLAASRIGKIAVEKCRQTRMIGDCRNAHPDS